MVRINLIEPSHLSDQHLLAEWVEIQMLMKSLYNKLQTKSVEEVCKNIPDTYRLGKGHIKFFENKLSYLFTRLNLIHNTMLNRGFNPNKQIIMDLFEMLSPYRELFNGWIAGSNDYLFIIERLRDRIQNPLKMNKNNFTIAKIKVNTDVLFNLLNNIYSSI